MQRVVDFFLGTCRLCVTGPWTEDALNAFARQRIRFWNLTKSGGKVQLTVYAADFAEVQAICEKTGCTVEQVQHRGAGAAFRGLRGRWLLFVGLLLAGVTAVVLQRFIWHLDVEGNTVLADEQILQALESIGIGIGTPAGALDGQEIKNQMLALLPELEWISVNKHGMFAQVLVRERTEAPKVVDPHLCMNLVAAKAGVITDLQVYSGFAAVEKGKAVLEGELLVSGMGSGWGAVVLRNAQAEVYADTRYDLTAVTPAEHARPDYTGSETRSWSLRIGKKQWNFSRSSGISWTGYDKIETVYQLELPGGIRFPVALVRTVRRAYDAGRAPLERSTAQSMLGQACAQTVARQLIAGSVHGVDASLVRSGGLYRYRAVTAANEMIARAEPINPLAE